MNFISSRVKNIKKTINGYEINTDTDFIVINEDQKSVISLEIDVLSEDGNIAETKVFIGKIDSTIRDLKKIFDYPTDIILCENMKRSVIRNEDTLVLDVFMNVKKYI